MKRKLILILSVLLFMGAVAITAYPMIANYINDMQVTGLSVTSFFSISSVMSRTSYSLLPAPYLMRGSRKA